MRRSIYIEATPERVWEEFESFERMQQWFGIGHELVKYEPRTGGRVELDASEKEGIEMLIFSGCVTVFDPPRELTFESEWVGAGWKVGALITFRLTPVGDGTHVELFHHGFERLGVDDPGELHRGFEGGWDMRHLEALRTRVVA